MKDIEVYENILRAGLRPGLYTLWGLADLLHDRCMQKIIPGNGARIAQLRRVGESAKYPLVVYDYHNDCQHLHIVKENQALAPSRNIK